MNNQADGVAKKFFRESPISEGYLLPPRGRTCKVPMFGKATLPSASKLAMN
jgi:hypothetical protein